ncbi:hypothetical protein E1301_Tti007644 [Triplophysa tibetana]|uniref:Uncharacterized protein n=1 Tax=Triplophysa tibetana TaxID=1572043 RepID=A0A5A9PAQ2_9TELE|nr:hypothetical protein E1301_Tti007644 [Triplophysa tibetana]
MVEDVNQASNDTFGAKEDKTPRPLAGPSRRQWQIKELREELKKLKRRGLGSKRPGKSGNGCNHHREEGKAYPALESCDHTGQLKGEAPIHSGPTTKAQEWDPVMCKGGNR